MITRLVTGGLLGGVVLVWILTGPVWSFMLGLVVVGGVCAHELQTMAMPGRRVEPLVGAALCMVALGVVALPMSGVFVGPRAVLGVLSVVLLVPPMLVLARPDPLPEAGHRLLALWAGLVYIGGAFAFLMVLGRRGEHLLLAFFIVFGGDTGAYFAGRLLGHRKLYEKISPKKTVAGSVGGLAASVLCAFFVRWALLPELTPMWCVALGLGGGALGQIGDLAESALKRAYGVKDSGRILPGHGGFLDRVDGLLFAGPLLALALF